MRLGDEISAVSGQVSPNAGSTWEALMVLPVCTLRVPSFWPSPAEVEEGRGAVLRKRPVFTPVSVRSKASTSPVVLFCTCATIVCAVVMLVLESGSVTVT